MPSRGAVPARELRVVFLTTHDLNSPRDTTLTPLSSLPGTVADPFPLHGFFLCYLMGNSARALDFQLSLLA